MLQTTDISPQADSGDLKVVLISPYELGRQPFALAQPAAWLAQAGFEVHCLDLALQKLEPEILAGAGLVAVYLGMHTATRIAVEALPRIRQLAPDASLCMFGLYAPMNATLFRELGAATIFGGESEPDILALAEHLRRHGLAPAQASPRVRREKIDFLTPDRSGLPALNRYAHLKLPGGAERVVGFAEASRGCKHLCAHCPVVPVYEGRFRIVPVDVIMADIRQQVRAGAQHISFGDPDFFNGPTHARRLLDAFQTEFPDLSFDATIKVEHLIKHSDLLPLLKDAGCLFITSAVESVDDAVLTHLDKGHSREDFVRAARLLREIGIALAPTFVPFNPWTTLPGYVDLLRHLVELELVEAVPPIQLGIRLLIPQGSYLLRQAGFHELIGDFDARTLGYRWQHRDARVDALQQAIQAWVEQSDKAGLARREVFAHIWALAHDAMDITAPPLPPGELGQAIPHMSEPWYCCAEPTSQQLQNF